MSNVESVSRAMRIIETLARAPGGLSETSRSVDLPKSTVARLLSTLESLEAVERDPDGKTYRIGPMIKRLPAVAGGLVRLSSLARPYLEDLTATTGEAAGLSVPDGHMVRHVDQTEARHPVQVRDWTGELVPMHIGPSGFCMMAHWPAEQTDRYLETNLVRLTEKTITDPDDIRERLEEVRTQGYIWGFEEYVEGINSVAAPVLAPGGAIMAALHVHGPAYRFPEAGELETIGLAVFAAARSLSVVIAA